jgi:hypothetical protein
MTLRAQLIEADGGPELMAVELPAAPFPGDIVRVADINLRVIRRTIIAVVGDKPPWQEPDRIDLELIVREA